MKQTNNQALNYDPKKESTWCVEDQPTSKLARQGSRSLTDSELIAVLLNGMSNATEVARSLYSKAGNNLNTLSHFSVEQLKNIDGITEKKAITIKSAFELGRRNQTTNTDKSHIKSSETISDLFKPLLADLQHEEFWLVCLNRANRILGKYKISQGGLSGTVIDTRIILKKSLDNLSSCIIVVHNHPSGNIQPSDADINITKKLKAAAELLEIKLLDHVIISSAGYFSFADDGIL